MNLHTLKKDWIFLTLLLTLGVGRIIQILIQSPSVTGYDYGFYRFSTLHPNTLSFKHFFTGIFGGFDHIILAILGKFGHTDIFLIGSIILWSILTGWLMYLVCKPYGTKTASLAVMLLTFSVAQSQVVSFFLWKTAIGLPLLLLFMLSLQKKKYLLTITTLLGLLITHTTSLLIAGLIFATHSLDFLFKKDKTNLLIITIFTLLTIILITANQNAVNAFLHYPNQTAYQGIFLDPWYYLVRQWPIVLTAVFGIAIFLKRSLTSAFTSLFIFSFLWVAFVMPFSQRMVLYFDLSAIFFASYALTLLPKKYYANILIPACIVVYSTVGWWLHISSATPLISSSEIQEIQNFKPQSSGSFLLSIDANDAPWILGYSNNLRLGAPGLFEDARRQKEWEEFWDNQNPIQFLEIYPKPLFLYSRSSIIPERLYPCLSQISQNIWSFQCN